MILYKDDFIEKYTRYFVRQLMEGLPLQAEEKSMMDLARVIMINRLEHICGRIKEVNNGTR